MANIKTHLKSGESLNPGECLVSADRRFRLYLEEDGNLVAYSYSSTKGIWRFYRAPVEKPEPNSKLTLELLGSGASKCPEIVLRNARGKQLWIPADSRSGYFSGWVSTGFVMQNDGNIVHYAMWKPSGPSTSKAVWSSGTDKLFKRPIVIPPNVNVCEIPAAGTLILGDAVGNTEIVNDTKKAVAIRDAANVLRLPPNKAQQMDTSDSGRLNINYYEFKDLRAPDGTKPLIKVPPSSSDATPYVDVRKPPRGKRNRIMISSRGLSLRTTAVDK